MNEKRLLLNTAKNTKKSLARLIREYYSADTSDADVTKFRAVAYAVRLLLDFFAYEREGELQERLDRIEEAMHGKKGS
jgi:hypothetical protein